MRPVRRVQPERPLTAKEERRLRRKRRRRILRYVAMGIAGLVLALIVIALIFPFGLVTPF